MICLFIDYFTSLTFLHLFRAPRKKTVPSPIHHMRRSPSINYRRQQHSVVGAAARRGLARHGFARSRCAAPILPTRHRTSMWGICTSSRMSAKPSKRRTKTFSRRFEPPLPIRGASACSTNVSSWYCAPKKKTQIQVFSVSRID